jgi:hypothetical protein
MLLKKTLIISFSFFTIANTISVLLQDFRIIAVNIGGKQKIRMLIKNSWVGDPLCEELAERGFRG